MSLLTTSNIFNLQVAFVKVDGRVHIVLSPSVHESGKDSGPYGEDLHLPARGQSVLMALSRKKKKPNKFNIVHNSV